HCTASTNIKDCFKFFQGLEVLTHNRFNFTRTTRQVMSFELFNGSERSSTCNWVTAVGATQGTWDWAVHDFRTASHTRQWHTSGDALSGSYQVGDDLLVFGSEPLSSASKAGLDFISDENNFIIAAPLRNSWQETFCRHDETAFTLNRLDNNTSQVFWANLLVQDLNRTRRSLIRSEERRVGKTYTGRKST